MLQKLKVTHLLKKPKVLIHEWLNVSRIRSLKTKNVQKNNRTMLNQNYRYNSWNVDLRNLFLEWHLNFTALSCLLFTPCHKHLRYKNQASHEQTWILPAEEQETTLQCTNSVRASTLSFLWASSVIITFNTSACPFLFLSTGRKHLPVRLFPSENLFTFTQSCAL